MGKKDDKGCLTLEGEIPSSTRGADNRKPAGHGFGGCVGPSGAPFGADKKVGLGEERGHPGLREVEVKLVRDRGFDEGPGVEAILAHEAVEEDEPEAGKFLVEFLGGLDDMMNALSFLVDAAVTENLEFRR